MPKIKDIVEIEEKNKEFAEKDLEKAKLPNVIRLLAKQVGYNQCADDLGNKSIGLTNILDIERVLLRVFEKNREATCLDYAKALKQAEGEIICEVKD